jgi:phospholipid transport system substrate-binding protein
MTFRRCFTVLFLAIGALAFSSAARAEVAGPAAVPQSLCDSLIGAMKKGSALTYAQRVELLAPEISKDLDLGLMARLVVGPPWRSFTPAEQQGLVKAFSDYSIATYAQRFKGYSGERFEVDPNASPLPHPDDVVVHTKLFTGGSDFVQLDYMMRKTGEQWRIIDVFLSGTISELAARRSEYSTTLRQGGAAALIDLLNKKTAQLGT